MRRLLLPLALYVLGCTPPVQEYEPPCDACGVCDNDRTNDCALDCSGKPGGMATLDECGDCVGGETGKPACEEDCAGVFGGQARVDDCGECAGGTTGKLACGVDCADVKGGTAWIDRCGDCVGGTTEKEACKPDCAGSYGGTATIDECGACTGGETGLLPCGEDCAGDPDGHATVDLCGVCDDDPFNDCELDCEGVPGGPATLDACDVCDAEPANDCPTDCAEVGNGPAFLDKCGACVAGTTGLSACVRDCSGIWGGDAAIDRCGVCSGGKTGVAACALWCEPFARSLAKSGHAWEGSESIKKRVPTDESWYGLEDQVTKGLSWLESSSPLSLPPGEWKIQWKLAPGDTPRDVRLSVRAALEEFPCVEFKEIRWLADEQSQTGGYGVSPAFEFRVEGDRLCPIRARALSEPEAVIGYRLDWVKATPLCDSVEQCPVVPGADATCDERECRYSSPDSDKDGFCDAIDTCPDGDDRIDFDGDEFPDDCDCDPKHSHTTPRAPELCGGSDNNCNGLAPPLEQAGTRMFSLVRAEREPVRLFTEKRSDESPFGAVLSFAEVKEFKLHGGPPVLLNPGRYRVTYRIRPTKWAFGESMFDVGSSSALPCVDTAVTVWRPEDGNDAWMTTRPAEFNVTSFDCPITPRIQTTAGESPSTGQLDSMTIVALCGASEDCPEYSGHAAKCKEGSCLYEAETGACEP